MREWFYSKLDAIIQKTEPYYQAAKEAHNTQRTSELRTSLGLTDE